MTKFQETYFRLQAQAYTRNATRFPKRLSQYNSNHRWHRDIHKEYSELILQSNLFIHNPGSTQYLMQSKIYSSYKSHHTLKCLIGA